MKCSATDNKQIENLLIFRYFISCLKAENKLKKQHKHIYKRWRLDRNLLLIIRLRAANLTIWKMFENISLLDSFNLSQITKK